MSDILRKATDADYNAHSREVIGKVAMYLNGNAAEPVEFTREDYLIDMSIMEEASADDSTPFGNVTANEVVITLYNEKGIFSPTNTSSSYFGKMRRGVTVVPYMRTSDTAYEPLGTFYVNDWNATITGTTAVVTAADKLYDMLDTPVPALPVVRNVTFKDFILQVFRALNIGVGIDDDLEGSMLMSYNTEAFSGLLTNIAIGSMSSCFCDHTGEVKFKRLVANRTLRATLTDENQIISIDANLGLMSDYNGAAVTYNVPQESATIPVLSVSDIVVPNGDSFLPTLQLSEQPMIRLVSALLTSSSAMKLMDIKSNSASVSVRVDNMTGEPQIAKLDAIGTKVETVSTTIGDTGNGLLEVNNVYIQSAEYAEEYLRILKGIVDNATPILTVEVRGNPLLNLLDKVRVTSTMYNVDFTGLILRNTLNYNGSLHSTLTLLNIDVLEEV